MEAVSRSAPTLDEVARAAGVSRATASRVFGGHPQVSEAARKAVELAASELGYVPNRAARSLAAGRSESVGVLISEPGSQRFADPMLARLLSAIAEELSAKGLQMVLFAPQSATDIERLEQYLAGGHVDAVLLLALHESESLPARLHARGIPMVFGGWSRGAGDASRTSLDRRVAPWSGSASRDSGRPCGTRDCVRTSSSRARSTATAASSPWRGCLRRSKTSTQCTRRPTRWPRARCGPCRCWDGACQMTSRSSDSTTRRSRPRPSRRDR